MSSAPAIPPLDNTLGAVLIGAVLGTFLFGIATLQAFNYYRRYPDDSTRLKTMVACIWLIELGHSIVTWTALYQITVTFYGQEEHIFDPPHALPFTLLFSAMMNLVVQTYFALRIRTLSKRWFITAICSALTISRAGFNVVMFIEFIASSGFAIFQNKLRWLMLCVSTIGPAVDVIIATSLCYYLWNIKSNVSPFQHTRRMIDTLILWSLETTSITCAAGVMQLVLFLSLNNLVWITFFLLQPKLFSNSILAHLNGRKRFRNGNALTMSDHTDSRGRADRSVGVVIQMHTMTDAVRDPGFYPSEKRIPTADSA
ncbi:hypothetical protein GGX14DRAFT_518659 [Mycena pura]|uniref:DUF6534 domain-containing protein n=1 Tax=Mycena pura TaxID=153505 RepID=A0AAD6VK02_9AGAR|nr:hypothetical protein GGX14DRAFT_518659 [Mycena pura]